MNRKSDLFLFEYKKSSHSYELNETKRIKPLIRCVESPSTLYTKMDLLKDSGVTKRVLEIKPQKSYTRVIKSVSWHGHILDVSQSSVKVKFNCIEGGFPNKYSTYDRDKFISITHFEDIAVDMSFNCRFDTLELENGEQKNVHHFEIIPSKTIHEEVRLREIFRRLDFLSANLLELNGE